MSDVIAFTVILEKPINDEYAERIADAIRMIRGVSKVTEHTDSIETLFAQERARQQLTERLWKALKSEL